MSLHTPTAPNLSPVADEQVFTVTGAKAVRAERVSMVEAGLLERQHLQEWIKEYPDMLGEDVLIVTEEFDRWATSSGAATADRLDLLGLDRTGRLVVAELKRHRAPDSVLVQALNYTAMASRFTLDDLIEAHGRFRDDEATAEMILDDLREWAPNVSDESLGPPRMVLVAEDFSPVLTNTTMFLIESGVDLRLIRIGLYRIDDAILAMTSSQVLPVPQAEEFMIRPRSAGATQRATRSTATRQASVAERLVGAQTFADGQRIRLSVPANVGEDRGTIEHWLSEQPERAHVRWRLDPKEPLEWAIDGSTWGLRSLIRHIVVAATGEQPRTALWGPNWFLGPDGRPLNKIADDIDTSLAATRESD